MSTATAIKNKSAVKRQALKALESHYKQVSTLHLRQLFAEDPKASDILYIKSLSAPFTVNTMPEATLKALAAHTELGELLPNDGGDCEEVIAQFAKAGIDVDALGTRLQDEGADSFVKSWNELMGVISSKSAMLTASSKA